LVRDFTPKNVNTNHHIFNQQKIINMKTILMSFMLFSTLWAHAQQPIEGTWNTGKDNTQIEITEANGIYEGKIHSSENENAKIGKRLLKDIKLIDGEWKGKLFAAKKGEWVDATLKEEEGKLLVTVDVGWTSKTIKWSRD